MTAITRIGMGAHGVRRKLDVAVTETVPANDGAASWIVARTKGGHERTAMREAFGLGYLVWFPMTVEAVRCGPDRKVRMRRVPAFQPFIFVGLIDRQPWSPLASCRGIVELIKGAGMETPAPVPPAELARIAELTGAAAEAMQRPRGWWERAALGSEVRVKAGPFTDFRGWIESSNAERVGALVEFFGRKMRFDFDPVDLELV